ncbi:hypothetical protein EDB19DRAFT_1948190 [Suillus lakei]|nr:hypothetical protein EDB19DRAFT_1948190 [Suillus lakei]
MAATGVLTCTRFRRVKTPKGKYFWCIAFACDDPCAAGERLPTHAPPEARYKALKEALGKDGPPHWYRAILIIVANNPDATAPKTPPRNSVLSAKVGLKSTPRSVGSAVVSEHISTVGIGVANVRPWIMRDVQNFEKCESDTMLQELLEGCTGPSQSFSASEKSTLLQTSLDAVIPICNEGAVAQDLEIFSWVKTGGLTDEADVLFDPDYQESTRMLLAVIAAARGQPVPVISPSALSSTPDPECNNPHISCYISFKLPPILTRLASPRLHHLPPTLRTEHTSWTGGNKNADIEHRIRHVWAEDALVHSKTATGPGPIKLSKLLVFCSKRSKVEQLAAFLDGRGIKCVALASGAEARKRGSNHSS